MGSVVCGWTGVMITYDGVRWVLVCGNELFVASGKIFLLWSLV